MRRLCVDCGSESYSSDGLRFSNRCKSCKALYQSSQRKLRIEKESLVPEESRPKCIDCNVGSAVPGYPRCRKCHNVAKTPSWKAINDKNKKERHDNEAKLIAEGKKVCTCCNKIKPLTAFKKKNDIEYTKLCDSCLIYLHNSNRGGLNEFTPITWRKLAYNVNKGAQIRATRKRGAHVAIQDIPSKITGEELAALFENQNHKCIYCGVLLEGPKDLTMDHRDPVSLGGSYDISNIDIVCRFCQRLKWDLTPRAFRELLDNWISSYLSNRSAG